MQLSHAPLKPVVRGWLRWSTESGYGGGQGCTVGQEDHMKMLRGKRRQFQNQKRLNTDIPTWLAAPSPSIHQWVKEPFCWKTATLLAGKSHRFHSGKSVWKKRDEVLQRAACTFNFSKMPVEKTVLTSLPICTQSTLSLKKKKIFHSDLKTSCFPEQETKCVTCLPAEGISASERRCSLLDTLSCHHNRDPRLLRCSKMLRETCRGGYLIPSEKKLGWAALLPIPHAPPLPLGGARTGLPRLPGIGLLTQG